MIPPARRRRRALTLAAATSVLVVLAGCGGSDKSPTTASTPAPAQAPATTAKAKGNAFTVTEREYSLSPANPDVPKGSFTISVRNAGGVQHALEVEGPAGEVKTGTIEPGGTAQLTVKLTKPGRYEWYCPIDDHKGKGMRGTIVVAGGGSAGADDSHKGSGHRKRSRDKGHSGPGGGNDDSAGSNSGSNSGGSDMDSGGIGPSNDSGGYGPG